MVAGREQLAAWIKRAKVKKGDAAELIGISRSFMSHILGGHRRPTLPNAVKIQEVTGIPVEAWVPTGRGKSARTRKPQQKQPVLA
jgi:plasmid maintenance system antidote protein VapI